MTIDWTSFALGALAVLLAEGSAFMLLYMFLNKGTKGTWF